jgi:hypothetical protein
MQRRRDDKFGGGGAIPVRSAAAEFGGAGHYLPLLEEEVV